MTPDKKRNQADQDQSDVPREGVESSEPEIEGRMRGRDADEQVDKLDAAEEPARKPGRDHDWSRAGIR